MTKIKDLPAELILLVEKRWLEQHKFTSKLPPEKYEWSVSSLITFVETPEHQLDNDFWWKVNNFQPIQYEELKRSPAYPKFGVSTVFNTTKIDKQLSEVEFYDKYYM